MPQLHTDRVYEEELQQLRAKILEMGGLVEKQIGDAMTSLVDRNSPLAQEVRNSKTGKSMS